MTTATEMEQVVDSLTAFATLPDWLAAPMHPGRVGESLGRHVAEVADGGLCIVSCTTDRLRAKGAEWLARCTVRVQDPRGGLRDVVLVGNLRPPGQPFPGTARAPGPGAAFGEPGWGCALPDLRLELEVQEHDTGLPSLPVLVEPAAAAQLIQPLLRAAGYADVTITSCRPEVVRYKPGSRCTVVVELGYRGDAQGPTPVVLKTHQGEKGESAWRAMTALWERPEGWQHAVRLAEPIGYLPGPRILVQGPVPEDRTLKELARQAIAEGGTSSLDDLRGQLARTARALAAVHGSGASYGRTATLEEELAEVNEVVDRLAVSVPALGPAAAPLLQLLAQRSAAAAPDPPVPAHHDFRPAQVLLHGGGVGFIDFDGACMAEPALDLGRFRAKLRDIGISTVAGTTPTAERTAELLEVLDDLCDHFLAEYQRHAAVSRDRVLLWETCDLVTTMLHAWTKVRLVRIGPRMSVLLHHLRTSGLLDATTAPQG